MKVVYIKIMDEIEKLSATNIIADSQTTLNKLKDFKGLVSNSAEGIIKRTLKSKFQEAKEIYDAFKQGYVLNVQYTKNMNLVVIPEFTSDKPEIVVAFAKSWNSLGVRSARKFFRKYFENVEIMAYEQVEKIENDSQ